MRKPMPVPNGRVPWLRKCTGQENRAVLRTRTPGAYEEHHILTALHAAFDFGEVTFVVYWLFINFKDNVAAVQAYIIGKGSTLHIGDDHALPGSDSEAVGHVRRERLDG